MINRLEEEGYDVKGMIFYCSTGLEIRIKHIPVKLLRKSVNEYVEKGESFHYDRYGLIVEKIL